MKKKILILAPFILVALAGCPSGGDTGDSGIEKVTIDPAKSTNGTTSGTSNPNVPSNMRSAIPGGK